LITTFIFKPTIPIMQLRTLATWRFLVSYY